MSMLKDVYPLYLNNKAVQPNTDLAVTDKYTGEVAFRVALADGKTQTIKFKQAIIAAGSEAVKLPFLPQDDRIVTSTGALQLRVDGRALGAVVPTQPEAPVSLSRAQVDALLVALRRDAPIAIVDAAGSAWPISNRGATALLLKMDEVQGRLDTPGALVRKGAQPESKVPAAVAAPPLKAPPLLVEAHDTDGQLAERTDLLQQLQPVAAARSACEQMSSRQLRIERVDATHVLALLNCATDRHIVPAGTWLIRDRPPFAPKLLSSTPLFPLYPHAVFLEEGFVAGTDACGTSRHWAWDGTRLSLSAEFVGHYCTGPSRRHWQLPTYVTDVR